MKTDTDGLAPLDPKSSGFSAEDEGCILSNPNKSPLQGWYLTGFTLIEILVVMAIITLIMTTVLYNTPLFNSKITMTQAARTLAFSLRDAQSRAVAVQVRSGSLPDAYGVWVTSSAGDLSPPNTIPDNQQYTLFTDSFDGNGRYTMGTGDCGGADDPECIERYTFQRNIRISSLLEPEPGGGPGIPATEFSVLFRRPDPAMSIFDGSVTFSPSAGTPFGPFKIFIQSSDASIEKEVDIWLTGQISIK